MALTLKLDEQQAADFKLLWAADVPALEIGPRFDLNYNQVYYMARKLGLPKRGANEVSRLKRRENSKENWKRMKRRLQKPAPEQVVAYFSGNNAVTMHKANDDTRKLIDEAVFAGKVQHLAPVDPESIEYILSKLRGFGKDA